MQVENCEGEFRMEDDEEIRSTINSMNSPMHIKPFPQSYYSPSHSNSQIVVDLPELLPAAAASAVTHRGEFRLKNDNTNGGVNTSLNGAPASRENGKYPQFKFTFHKDSS